jgi:predicted Zn-dependent protease
MKKVLLLFVTMIAMYGCSSVLLTGRKQLNLVTDEQVLALSDSSYRSFMQTAAISNKSVENTRVARVGAKLAAAVEAFMKNEGMQSDLNNLSWSFKLVRDTSVNAFCMPGGKIVVYEGLLPVTQTDEGLAVVIGHEIAHAVAKHANERMSQQMVANYSASALSSILQNKSQTTQTVAMVVFGLGAEYGVTMPYSRKQEYEADRLGLIFMAMAGYNPKAALDFWKRMSAASDSYIPEILSTHPSDSKRISRLESSLPEALKYYPVSSK